MKDLNHLKSRYFFLYFTKYDQSECLIKLLKKKNGLKKLLKDIFFLEKIFWIIFRNSNILLLKNINFLNL